MKRFFVAALMNALAAPALAGGIAENFETPAECKDTGGLKIEACLSALGGGLDAEVDSRLTAVLTASPDPDAVRAAQEAWLAYRKATCDYFAGQEGIAGVIQGLQCLRWTSWRRMKELDGLLGIVPAEESGEGEAEGGLWPDFSTLADTQYANRAFEFGDFSWYVKKRYSAALVEKALAARGFEAETARLISMQWDVWRYHLENGQPLLESAPMSASDADLQALAARFPKCMQDLGKTDCRVKYSIELGCRLDPAMAKGCQSVFDIHRAIAASYQRDGRKAYLLSSYGMAGCLMEVGKGAGVVVFAPDTSEAVAKLVFVAQSGADVAETTAVDIETLPEREAELCSVAVGWTFDEIGNQTSAGSLDLVAESPDRVFSEFIEEAQTNDPARAPDYADYLQRVVKAAGEVGQ